MFFIIYSLLTIATTSQATTCGYKNGDPQSARTAQSGYRCRVDTANGLWGFCPTTVISAADCGLAGVCVDNHSCTDGCGRLTGRVDIATFSCERPQFCSTLLLINGPDQSFEYIACGAEARTDRLLPAPNTAVVTTTTLSSSFSSLSSSSTSPASRPTATVTETSVLSISASSLGSNNVVNSLLASSTSSPIPPALGGNPLNLAAIVGGAIGGLAVICLTVLGIVLIRRKNGAKGQTMPALGQANNGQNGFEDDDMPLHSTRKTGHWSTTHGPVEMYSGHHVNMEPIELSGSMKWTEGIR